MHLRHKVNSNGGNTRFTWKWKIVFECEFIHVDICLLNVREHRKLDSEKKNDRRQWRRQQRQQQRWRGHELRLHEWERRCKYLNTYTHTQRLQLLIHSQFLYWLLAIFKLSQRICFIVIKTCTLHIYRTKYKCYITIYQFRIFGMKSNESEIAFRFRPSYTGIENTIEKPRVQHTNTFI